MDWAAIGSRAAVRAVCEHFRVDFAQAEDYLFARQLHGAEERAVAEADEEDEEEEEEVEEDDDEDEPAVIIPMPGQDTVSVGAMVVGMDEEGFQDGAAAAAMFRYVYAMLQLPDGRLLVADSLGNPTCNRRAR